MLTLNLGLLERRCLVGYKLPLKYSGISELAELPNPRTVNIFTNRSCEV